MNAETGVDVGTRKRAIAVLGITIVLAIVTWFLLARASESGLERLARLERVKTLCDSLFATARSETESLRVVHTPLPDTIDPQSRNGIRECGDTR